jgi:hypothetical protein
MHAQKRHPAAYSRLPYNIKHRHSFASKAEPKKRLKFNPNQTHNCADKPERRKK